MSNLRRFPSSQHSVPPQETSKAGLASYPSLRGLGIVRVYASIEQGGVLLLIRLLRISLMVSIATAIVVVGMLLHVPTAFAGTLVLQPDGATGKDTTIGYGGGTGVQGAKDFLYVGYNMIGSSVRSRVLLGWNVSALPANAVIGQAELLLDGAATECAAPGIEVFTLTRADWNEAEANWNEYKNNTDWTTRGGDFDPTALGSLQCNTLAGSNPARQQFSIDVTSLIRARTSNQLNLLLKQKTTGDRANFYSSDNTVAAARPQLKITYSIPGEISGTVFDDKNRNGVQSSDEPGLASVSVQLIPSSGGGTTTVTTDATGRYSFPNLSGEMSYRVVVPTQGRILDEGWLPPASADASTPVVQPVRPIAIQKQLLKFCFVDNQTSQPVAGARVQHMAAFDVTTGIVSHNALSRNFLVGNPPNNDAPYLVAGADGCTNPTFIDYKTLKENNGTLPFYYFRYDHPTYNEDARTFRFDNAAEQIITVGLVSSSLKICTTTASSSGTWVPVDRMEITLPEVLYKPGLPASEKPLKVGADGCTNPTFINYAIFDTTNTEQQRMTQEKFIFQARDLRSPNEYIEAGTNWAPSHWIRFFEQNNTAYEYQLGGVRSDTVTVRVNRRTELQVLSFCVYQQQPYIASGQEVPIANAQVRPIAGNASRVVTDSNGCGVVTQSFPTGQSYTAEASATGYKTAQQRWTRTSGSQTVKMYLASDTPIVVQGPDLNESVTKTASPSSITGPNQTTRVSVILRVEGASGQSLTNVEFIERLTTAFRFSDSPTVTVTRLSGASPGPVTFTGTLAPNAQSGTLALGALSPGSYEVAFTIKYIGTATNVTVPIDVFVASAGDTCSQQVTTAHIRYLSGTEARCRQIDPGSLTIQSAQASSSLQLLADTWLGGTQTLTFGGKLQGPAANGLFVTGGAVNGYNGVTVPNYGAPTSGASAWNVIAPEMVARVNRVSSMQVVKLLPCPGGQLRLTGPLYLGTSSASIQESGTSAYTGIWRTPDGCQLTLDGVQISGKGTIITVGGTLDIRGAVTTQTPTSSLGYIGLPKNNSGGTVMVQASTQNSVIYTPQKLTFAVPSSPTVHTSKFIGRTMTFPKAADLTQSITFAPAPQLLELVPPLFEAFTVPTGSEVP